MANREDASRSGSGLGSALRRALGATPPIREQGSPRRETVLMNLTRLRVLEALCNRPCAHLRWVSRTVGVTPPSVLWHIGKLAAKGLVTSRLTGRRRIHYPMGLLEAEDVELLGFLGSERRSAIVRHLAEHPGATQGELVRITGANSHTLRGMVSRSVLDEVKDGRHRRYYHSPMLRRRRESMDRRARRFKQLLLTKLEEEGLAPETVGSDHDVLELRVKIGGEFHTLSIRRNPYIQTGAAEQRR
jgi:DNA-binding transcriptional ArsR family regulator